MFCAGSEGIGSGKFLPRHQVFADWESLGESRTSLGSLPATVTTRNWQAGFCMGSIKELMSLEKNLRQHGSKLLVGAVCLAFALGLIDRRSVNAAAQAPHLGPESG